MKKLALLGLLLLHAGTAQAQEACCREESHWYGSISAMGTASNEVTVEQSPQVYPFGVSYDTSISPGITAAAGYQLFPNASFEIEYIGQFQDIDGTTHLALQGGRSQKHNSVMINHRWVCRQMGSIAPYLGAGVGMMIADHGDYTVDDGVNPAETQSAKDVLFAYQFMAGLNFAQPNSKMEFYLGYRYLAAQDLETRFNTAFGGFSFNEQISSHNLEAGIRMHF